MGYSLRIVAVIALVMAAPVISAGGARPGDVVALESGVRADFGNALVADAAAAIGLGPDMFINPILSGVIGEPRIAR